MNGKPFLIVFSIFIGLLFLLQNNSRGEESIITSLKEKSREFSSYTCKYSGTLKVDSQELKIEGEASFARDLGVKTEQKIYLPGIGSYSQILVANTEEAWIYQDTWIYQHNKKICYHVNLESLRENFPELEERFDVIDEYDLTNLTGFYSIQEDSLSQVGEETVQGVPSYVFEAKMGGINPFEEMLKGKPIPGFRKGKIWVEKERGIIRRVVLYNEAGDEIYSCIFTEVKPKISLGLGEYRFSPPLGTRIIEVNEILEERLKK